MQLNDFLAEWHNDSDTINVQTSGSTGTPKKLSVEKQRMVASANMTCDFLKLRTSDKALLCMPLDYIAGKMMVVRSIVRGMKLISVPPSSHPLKGLTETPDFAAMVPMQVKATLEDETEREIFSKIRNVIIGGGSIDSVLESQLKTMPNAVWSTYGMTETLSHIALRRINGENSTLWYTPLPGIDISVSSNNTLIVNAPQLCKETLHTNDIIETNEKGQFRIIGRTDNVINSGGVKIQAEEVERWIENHCDSHIASKIMITKCPDSKYGEIVAMLVENTLTPEQQAELNKAITTLPRYWKPRKIVETDTLPRTETGKPDRATARKTLSYHS